MESSGNISIFYYLDEEVKYGLPIMQGTIDASHHIIPSWDHYSCVFCGFTSQQKPTEQITCPGCKKTRWVKSSNKKRIR